MAEVLTGEVQQYDGKHWRTVLTGGGIPVDDQRRRPANWHEPPGSRAVDVSADVFAYFQQRIRDGKVPW